MIRSVNRYREEFVGPQGPLTIVDWCDPAFIASHEMEEGLGVFPSYRSLFSTPEGLARMAHGDCSDVVLGLNADQKIIGYCILREPEGHDFWSRLGPGTLYEIAALEVSRNFRLGKLGRRLLDLGLTNDVVDDRITYMVGYSWTWDLQGTGLTAGEYRQMLMNMLLPYGFKRYPTNEPNVSLRPENVFMARIGQGVSQETIKRFKNLLFGIEKAT
ncbi:MAG: N-acetyltransferase [Deltaproteobacteria bacterium]|nr:N-acetyltransferase [Deltaproteobacteria bacterium]